MPNDKAPRHLSLDDVVTLVERALAEGHGGIARKSRAVLVRPARIGEVIVTVIAGEGKETQSHPAAAGDWVVRNRIAGTGGEEYLVDADEFEERYRLVDQPPDAEGWRTALPRGQPVRYWVVSPEFGEFTFEAPWGETMVARTGDAIVQDYDDPRNTWRVAAGTFAETYELMP
jgi:hypothetical protein